MENFDIESIKDAVYELEGLLELAELREDKHSALLPLMQKKLQLINAIFDEVKISEVIQDEEDEELPEEMDTEEEIVMTPMIEETEENPSMEDKAVEEESLVTEEEPSEVHTSELTAEVEADDDIVEISAPVPVIEEEVTPIQEKAPRSNTQKPAFCINDRFRFRRELFHNSDSEFNATMDLVATMADYEEAEEYFIGEKEWNPEKEEVIDFMNIIRLYFENQ